MPPRIICTTPERVAKAAVKAIHRNRRLVIVEPFARLMYATKRFAPGCSTSSSTWAGANAWPRKMAELEQAA